MKRANIFDIQRFSFHDGNGIRTNIFFKGCSLNCSWCQNPEGLEAATRLIYNKKACINCMICLSTCPQNALSFDGEKIVINHDKCIRCGKCGYACPTNALKLDSFSYTVDELLEEVLKDQKFFKNGGGVTVSGGEPLLQVDFIYDFYTKLKELGIHTAIETALNVPLDSIKKILPLVDQIFLDLKIFDNKNHKAYIGCGNEKILENIAYILTSEHKEKVVVRTPMIPEITTSRENIFCIAKYISDLYDDVNYELLNYNPLAESKYKKLEKKFLYKKNPTMYAEEDMEKFRDIAKKAGVINIIRS